MKQPINKKLPDGEEYPTMVVMTKEKFDNFIKAEINITRRNTINELFEELDKLTWSSAFAACEVENNLKELRGRLS